MDELTSELSDHLEQIHVELQRYKYTQRDYERQVEELMLRFASEKGEQEQRLVNVETHLGLVKRQLDVIRTKFASKCVASVQTEPQPKATSVTLVASTSEDFASGGDPMPSPSISLTDVSLINKKSRKSLLERMLEASSDSDSNSNSQPPPPVPVSAPVSASPATAPATASPHITRHSTSINTATVVTVSSGEDVSSDEALDQHELAKQNLMQLMQSNNFEEEDNERKPNEEKKKKQVILKCFLI